MISKSCLSNFSGERRTSRFVFVGPDKKAIERYLENGKGMVFSEDEQIVHGIRYYDMHSQRHKRMACHEEINDP